LLQKEVVYREDLEQIFGAKPRRFPIPNSIKKMSPDMNDKNQKLN